MFLTLSGVRLELIARNPKARLTVRLCGDHNQRIIIHVRYASFTYTQPVVCARGYQFTYFLIKGVKRAKL